MSAAVSTEASSLTIASERSKDPAKVAAGQKGGQAGKHPEAPGQAPAPVAKQPAETPFDLPRRREDFTEGRLERERRAATPSLAAALDPVLRDPVIAGLSGPAFRVFLTLLAEAAADGRGRVPQDSEFIIARALFAEPVFDRFGEREAPAITWERIRAELAAHDLIELGEDDIFVYLRDLAPAPGAP